MTNTRLITRCAAAAAAALVALAPTASADVQEALCPGGIDRVAEAQLRALTNQFRADNGVRPLRPRAVLTRAARDHSVDMAASGYFQHSNAGGSFWWAAGRAAGENLALAADPWEAMAMLAQSPSHRRTLLSPAFRGFGIGAVRTCTGHLLVTQDFQG